MSNQDPAVSNLMQSLGMRIRTARMSQKMRLADVAKRSGYSASFLSQVERGIANPSVGALKHIADALSIPAADIFFSDEGEHQHAADATAAHQRPVSAFSPVVVPRDRRKAITYPHSSIRYELVVPHLQGALEVLWIEAPPGASTGEAYSHEAEECVLVVEGAIEVTIDDTAYQLAKGDSIVFRGDVPHGWRNSGTSPVTLLWVTTPPSF
jgi:transcriptional regulator with XRE-family HTH domain